MLDPGHGGKDPGAIGMSRAVAMSRLDKVVVSEAGRPSTGLDTDSVEADLVTNGATIGSARLVSPW